MSKYRVMVIGLDGATLDLILPWIEEGHLPTLASLIRNGSYGRLKSTIQPITAPAWTTFMTGVNQGKHGLYDFVRRRSDSYKLEITNASMIATPTIFEIIGQTGGRVIALNVPYTFPPPPVNGILVSGLFAPTADERIVYPSSFAKDLYERFNGYFITPDYNSHAQDPLLRYLDDLKRGVDYRRRLSLYLMNHEPWDLFAVVFIATDLVQHSFWRYMETGHSLYKDAILDVYRHVDDAMGALVQSLDDKTVVLVMSDHGAGPLHRMVNINRWLAENGYLRFSESGQRYLDRVRVNLVKSVASAYRRYTPACLRSVVRRNLGMKYFDRLKGEMESTMFSSTVNWSETAAYALGAGGNIYLNLAGREPEGQISPGHRYNEVRADVGELLSKMVDPNTGQSVVRKVWLREDLYQGPYLERAPDLVIEWEDYRYWGRGRYDISGVSVFEEIETLDFSALPLTGTHRPAGVLILSGPGVKPSVQLHNSKLLDLAPTILSILGRSVPEYMDGRILQEAFVSGAIVNVSNLAVRLDSLGKEKSQYSLGEEEEIMRRLEELGYL